MACQSGVWKKQTSSTSGVLSLDDIAGLQAGQNLANERRFKVEKIGADYWFTSTLNGGSRVIECKITVYTCSIAGSANLIVSSAGIAIFQGGYFYLTP